MSAAHEDAARHMDGIYRHQRLIYDATRKYYLLGRDRMLDELRPPPGGSVLEVGCGTGRNLILAARRYPGVSFYGFDISHVMLETAQRSVAKAGLNRQIRMAKGDASAFDAEQLFGIATFDRVFISYALSMIPPWREALPQAMRAVASDGSLHIVDFGQQAGWPDFFRKALFAWLAKFSVAPRAELENELKALAERTGAHLRFERLYRGYADYAVLSRNGTGVIRPPSAT